MQFIQVACEGEVTAYRQMGAFYGGDLLEVAPRIQRAYQKSVDVVYLEPPLPGQERQSVRMRLGEAGYRGAPAYSMQLPNDTQAFPRDEHACLALIKRALQLAHSCLKDSGSVYVHVDERFSAYVRILLDEIFGKRRFQNEIVWQNKTGGRSKRSFVHQHDVILVYNRSARPYFCPEKVAQKRGEGKRNHLRRNVDEHGNVYFSLRTGGREYRYEADSLVFLSDVWTDIPMLQQRDPERTGYPEQKPQALLSRILNASCPPNGCVMDLFCGSGTAAAVAAEKGCGFVASDASAFAQNALRKRMLQMHRGICIEQPLYLQGHAALCAHVKASAPEKSMDLCLLGYAGEDTCTRVAQPVSPSQLSMAQMQVLSAPKAYTQGAHELQNLAALDVISAGRMHDGIFAAHSVQLRTTAHPVLSPYLAIDAGKGMPCIQTIDACGQVAYFILQMQ